MSDISILKLMDGSTIVGRVIEGDGCVEIEHPIELVNTTKSVVLQELIGEQISLRPWMAIAEESAFIVERLNVITMGKLNKDFTAGYERMVEAIYYQKNRWSGGLYRADTEDMEQLTNEEEFDVDTLTELADAVIKKQIH